MPLLRPQSISNWALFLLAGIAACDGAMPAKPSPQSLAGRIVFVAGGDDRLFAMNLDGSDLVDLPIRLTGSLGSPTVAPDGFRVAFARQNDVYVADADGSRVMPIAPASGPDGNPQWSPVREEIVFESTRSGNGDLYIVSSAGTELRQLTNTPAWEELGGWSPDGERIVFAYDAGEGFQLATIRRDGTDRADIPTTNGGRGPAWSPDGVHIAYLSGEDNWLHVIEVSGANDRPLMTSGPTRTRPKWSPDGTLILFQETGVGIGVIGADGTGLQALPTGSLSASSPTWGP